MNTSPYKCGEKHGQLSGCFKLEELKRDVAELRDDVKELKVGFDNHLTEHTEFKEDIEQFIGSIKLVVERFGAKKYFVAAGAGLVALASGAEFISNILLVMFGG